MGGVIGEMLRGVENKNRSGESRIGQPFELLLNPWAGKRQPGELKHLSSQRKRKQKRFPSFAKHLVVSWIKQNTMCLSNRSHGPARNPETAANPSRTLSVFFVFSVHPLHRGWFQEMLSYTACTHNRKDHIDFNGKGSDVMEDWGIIYVGSLPGRVEHQKTESYFRKKSEFKKKSTTNQNSNISERIRRFKTTPRFATRKRLLNITIVYFIQKKLMQLLETKDKRKEMNFPLNKYGMLVDPALFSRTKSNSKHIS
ncbi:hypothetical protein RND71_038842 [Anisodus tanguticus]|uniref:Uncharacterized protein n=1 Tax=Anisodus tanguticus TaxID=243964 RepID=A0AAE1R107_9SOLA|nr:hypothetical protein RND71_038842 [Anisodus tanguticus]